jgi:hypothetical protein
MNQNTKRVVELAKTLHDEMRLSPVTARTKIPAAIEELSKIRNEAKRGDVVSLCDSTTAFLEGMARHDKYQSAFAGSLDLLNRRAGDVAEDEPSELQRELEALRAENKELLAKVSQGGAQ